MRLSVSRKQTNLKQACTGKDYEEDLRIIPGKWEYTEDVRRGRGMEG